MGGSGGSIFRSDNTPREVAERVINAQNSVASAEFKLELSQLQAELLARFNDRDHEKVQEELDKMKAHLEGTIEGTFDFQFGGSVAKHTYVDGLSDVDSLLIISDSGLGELNSAQALEVITKIFKEKMGDLAEVTHGQMAVTLTYKDGLELQVLPALRHDNGTLKVPSSRHPGEWSHINPANFQAALTRRNQECGGKLVPTIKLAKAILGTFPEAQRLSGYHVESLAISAFKGYEGERTTTQMLVHFMSKAKELVLAPVRDSTGQSIHVDSYLGPADSQARKSASHLLDRVAKRMLMATMSKSIPQWKDLFGLDG
jgi:Second Messenger Oligonucleotide or Dinucleotide Synthetase domain